MEYKTEGRLTLIIYSGPVSSPAVTGVWPSQTIKRLPVFTDPLSNVIAGDKPDRKEVGTALAGRPYTCFCINALDMVAP
jgi:hypothetical protein